MAYEPNYNESYSSTKYEGNRVQLALGQTHMSQNPTPFYDSYYPDIMTMWENEALVDSYTTEYFDIMYGTFRMGIAGKVDAEMMEGWIPDHDFKVASVANNVYPYARVALTAWAYPTSSTTAGADIPAGARLTTPAGIVLAYADGTRIKINGYYVGTDWFPKDAYVNTNWESGSTSSYYVQFT